MSVERIGAAIVAQATLDIPDGALGEHIALLQAIAAGQGENDAEISLVLNSLNTGIAKLVAKNGKIITDLQGKVLKKLWQHFVDNDNVMDGVSTAVLGWAQSELDDIHLLLTQLTAAGGLVTPGDPLESALIERLTEAPDMAYSATLFLALREAIPLLARMAVALERIAYGQTGLPVKAAPKVSGDFSPDEEETETGEFEFQQTDWPEV